jgi:hypothetical protein
MKTSVSIWHLLYEVQLNFRSSKRSGTASAKGKVKTLPSKKRKKRSCKRE